MRRLLDMLQSSRLRISEALDIVTALVDTDATAQWYETSVSHFIRHHGDLPIKAVTLDMVNEWSQALHKYRNPISNKRLTENTINTYRRGVRGFFNHLAEAGHLETSPVDGFKIPDPPKPKPKHLTEEQVRRLLDASKSDARDYAMMRVLYDSGCRIGELTSMRVSLTHIERVDADLSGDEKELVDLAKSAGLIHLIKQKYLYQYRGKSQVIGKGRNGRQNIRPIFFTDETCRALLDYIQARPHDAADALWLSSLDWTPIKKHSLYHAFKQVAKRAGVKATPHQLRHTFAYRLIRLNKIDPKIAQKLLGHADVLTTLRIYYNVNEDELWQAYEEAANSQHAPADLNDFPTAAVRDW